MKEKNLKTGMLSLRVDNLDDLWFLENMLSPGTIVGSETWRKLESRDDKLRPDEVPRVKAYLKVFVESTDFQEFRDVMRIKGRIVQGADGMEGYHTLSIGPGSAIDIWFKELTDVELGIVQEALDRTNAPKALAIFIDDRSQQVFRVHDYGIEELGTVEDGLHGKLYEEKKVKAKVRFSGITEMVRTCREEGTPIIIAGPGFFKEALGTHLKSEMCVRPQDLVIVTSSSTGRAAILEALSNSRGVSTLLDSLRVSEELSLLNDLMCRIGKGGLATYGRAEVRKVIETGAVEHLLVSEDLMRKEDVRDVLRLCQGIGARSTIISARHEQGRMFSRMGGIAALLRYRTDWN